VRTGSKFFHKCLQFWNLLLNSAAQIVNSEFMNTAADAMASDLTKRISALQNDPDGFFKLGGFMADSKSTAEELLSEAMYDKYGI